MKRKYQSIVVMLITMFVVTLLGSGAAERASGQTIVAPQASSLSVVVITPNKPGKPTTAEFTDIGANLPTMYYGSATWADYNNDGFLDTLLVGADSSGNPFARLYRNNGNGTFSEVNAGFVSLSQGSAAWGDYDNDGYLDLAISGRSAAGYYLTLLYHNNGDGSFSLVNANFVGAAGALAWGDYDNDGRLDLLVGGCTSDSCSSFVTNLYHNDGGGNFHQVTNSGIGTYQLRGAAWGDFNKDGFPDLLLSGLVSDFNAYTRLYLNNGDGTFTERTIDSNGGHLDIGDYDNDGCLDANMAGFSSGVRFYSVTEIYHGDCHGNFTVLNPYDTTVYNQAAWGDYDSDGRLDTLLSGGTGHYSTPATILYHNNSDGSFSADQNANLPQQGFGAVAWGDYNNDGKPDILAAGCANNCVPTDTTKIYRNDTVNSNTPPTAPSSLSASNLTNTSVQLNWQLASDDHTPASGLNYAVRVGTHPGASDVVGPMADGSTGYRRIPTLGNAYENTSFPIKGLQPGTTYYWSVQAIDTAFAGGSFATESSFTTSAATPTLTPSPQPTVCPNPFVDINTNIFFHAINSLYCQGVINGTDTTHYTPGGTATRGQFAKLVALAFGLPLLTPQSGQSFTDVPPGYFAYVYIESGYHAGILSGFDAAGCAAHNALYPCYLPNIAITRGQLTKLVVNAGGYALLTPASGPTFSDVPPSNVFYAFIETAAANHIISGYPDGTFRPNNNIRRDEMAQIVYAGQQNQPASPTPSNTPVLGMTDTPTQTATLPITSTPGGPTSTSTPTPAPSVTITPTVLR